MAHQVGDRERPQLREGLGDRGQRRRAEPGERDVVHAHHRDVLRHPAAQFVQGADQAEGHLVAGREDRGDVRDAAQDQPRPVAGRGRPVAVDLRRHGAALRLQRVAPAAQPAGGVQPLAGPGQVPDGLVAEVEQVPGGQPGGQRLVDGDDLGGGCARAVDGDGGQRGGELLDPPADMDERHREHEPLDALVGQPGHGGLDGGGVQGGRGGRGHREARLRGGALDAVHQAGARVVAGLQGDHADGQAAARGQHAGRVVLAVAQLLDGGEHLGPRAVVHVGVPAQRPRHRLRRDARDPGDVGHRHAAVPRRRSAVFHRQPPVFRRDGNALHQPAVADRPTDRRQMYWHRYQAVP
ncbi:hypothetical protein SBRY_160044 [Actinacidiphila bryophytorum]|uniref:Uncharacterized protein n=1 Tax=Actinacidiphila bryophytorum TaxID=1436133 RepID=A0A9W4E3T3_9ACTN|nr:hypothetical protein SBRY_160044 [Actinacidiphila bryophytorum]